MPTQTSRRAPAAKPGKPSQPDTTPALMRALRPWLTGLSLVMMLVGAFFAAWNLGRARSVYSGLSMILIGLTLAVLAQMRRTYEWSQKDNSPIVEHADLAPPARRAKKGPQGAVPKQRRARRQEPDQAPEFGIPTVKPSWALGPEFRYIVTYGRWLADEHPEVFDEMDAFWQTIDWSSDETDSDFREVVDFLYDLARALPTWDENATPDQMTAGTVARDNPFAFVAEAESNHPLIAAVAVMMLTRHFSDKVTADDIDQVLEPWTYLGLSYRFGDMVFSWNGTEYQAKEVESRTTPPAAAGTPAGAVVDVTDGTSRPPAVNFDAAAPAPRPVLPPAPAPEPQAPVKHAEPDQDDVPDPTAEQIVMAAELIISSQNGTPVMIQRKLRIGVALAAKIMFRLYELDIVGAKIDARGSREVMVVAEELKDTLDFVREQEAERNAK